MAEEELVQPGWRLPRSLMERVDRAYHTRKAQGPLALTKQEFVADLLSFALSQAKARERRSSAATGGS
jgi:hypothetical protein